MSPFSALLVAAVAAALQASTVEAHGKMVSPPVRLTNAKYNRDAHFSLRNAGNTETQIAPLELLNQRGQADNPAAATFDIMNGCRGIEYEAGAPTTSVTPGQQVPIRWEIAAPHPGYMEIYIVKATKEASGKVMYKQDGAALKRIENFATAGGAGSDSVTIPSTLTGCGTAGNCALQFYWYSPIAKQTYVNCADIVAAGTGNAATPPAAGSGTASRAPAASANTTPAAGGANTPATGGGATRPPTGQASRTPSGARTPPAAGGRTNRLPAGGATTPALTPTPVADDSNGAAGEATLPRKKACKKRVRRE